MRTSRISRDTAKVLSSLAASRARRSVHQARSAPIPPTRDSALNAVEAANVAREPAVESEPDGSAENRPSDANLSSAPADGHPEDDTMSSKKRKRGQPAPATTTVKLESEDIQVTAAASPKKGALKANKVGRVPAKRTVAKDGTVNVKPPPNWEEIYALTREMRNENVAPVDTMGCESLADRTATPRDQRFQTLVALMLSSQTKDTVTSVAIKGMQDNMSGGFNLESVLALDSSALNAFICKVGFHNLKTKYIKQSAEILRDKWNSDIPDTIQGLTSLPGVGPKMAYLCMSAAWGKDEGIGVDVHVHRITNLWGWHKTKQPEETRAALQSWLPQDRWHDINNLLVGFGQTICLPVGRKCGDCKLAVRNLCPSAVVAKTVKVKREAASLKVEGTEDESLMYQRIGVANEPEVKIEDVDTVLPDIEDLGRMPRRARTRK